MSTIILLWMLGIVCTSGLRVGTAGQKTRTRPSSAITKRPSMLPPASNTLADDADEHDETSGEVIQSNVMSLFIKEVKCIDVGHLPVPNECSKFWDCKKVGEVQKTVYCLNGELFDHLRRECTPAADARCRGLCRHEGEEYADPKNPNDYLRCESGVPMPKKCPEGKLFNETNQMCEYENTESSDE